MVIFVRTPPKSFVKIPGYKTKKSTVTTKLIPSIFLRALFFILCEKISPDNKKLKAVIHNKQPIVITANIKITPTFFKNIIFKLYHTCFPK